VEVLYELDSHSLGCLSWFDTAVKLSAPVAVPCQQSSRVPAREPVHGHFIDKTALGWLYMAWDMTQSSKSYEVAFRK
jgi:hypothetical protein